MKKKKDNKGFVKNEEFNWTLFDSHVESHKQQYLPFYDDVCSVKMELCYDITDEELKEIFSAFRDTFGKRKAILYFERYNARKMFFLVSRKFKENVDKMVKGSKVEFHDPEQPDRHDVAVVQSDGVSYDMGAVVVPLFDLFVEPKNCVEVAKDNDQGPYFAIFWRPVEEKK